MTSKVFVLILALLSSAPVWAQGDPEVTGGTGTLYLGGYPGVIWVIDEATERVIDEIKIQTGMPRRLVLSEDRTRFYMTDAGFQYVEVVDVKTRRSIDSFTLSDGNTRARIRSFRVHPDHQSAILVVDTAKKLADRFEIGPRKLLRYDLVAHKVVGELPWPNKQEQNSVNLLYSPDGKLVYFFSDDVIVLDAETFEEVDRWNLSQPFEPGLGRLDFGFSADLINEEYGFFTNLFRVRDDVQNRELMGVARINLLERMVDFYTFGPATRVSFALAPGRRKAYGLESAIGEYEFWTFDLEGRRVENRQRFAGRPRMSLTVSSNGRVLYIHNAGNTIDLYDAATYKYLRTITLDGDMSTDLIVLPDSAGPR